MTLPTLVGELRRQLVSDDADGAGARRWRRWPGSPARACPAPTRRSGGCCARSPTSGRCASPTRRCGSRRARSSRSATAGCAGCSARWVATARRWARPTSAPWSTTSPPSWATSTPTRCVAEVDARWGRLGMPAGWVSDRKRHEAHGMVRRLATYFDEARAGGWVRLGAELDMKVVLGRAVLSGKVDRIEGTPDGSGLRVVDYKTGSSKPRAEELARHPQLGAYQLGVESGAFGELGDRSAGAALLQVGKAALVKTTLQTQGPLRRRRRPAVGRRPGDQHRRGDGRVDVPGDRRRLVQDVPGAGLVPRPARGAGALMARAPVVRQGDRRGARASRRPPPSRSRSSRRRCRRCSSWPAPGRARPRR